MKLSCVRCERTSATQRLFCHDVGCPAELSPSVLDAGDWLGDIEVLKPITSLRSAMLYEALQQGQLVLLKVARPGPSHRDRLIREAVFLRSLRSAPKASAKSYPALPRLRPPYVNTTLEQDAFGMIMLGRELLYYALFDAVEGESLEDLLRQQPQWWVQHVGWLGIELSTTINALHLQGVYHFALTPASILVRFDTQPTVPHLFLCDLGIASTARDWYAECTSPAYVAPELLAEAGRVGMRTDVYGLGLVLYEMLVGQPVFGRAFGSGSDVVETVRRDERVAMTRSQDVSPVAKIAMRAAAANASQRHRTAADLAEELVRVVGEVPLKTSRTRSSLNALLAVAAAVLVITILVSLVLALSAT